MEFVGQFFGVIGLVAILAAAIYRLNMPSTTDTEPTGIFKIYLSLSILLGMGIVCRGLANIPEPISISLGLLMLGWNGISAMAMCTAPLKWSVFPIGYIVLCVLYIAYTLFTAMDNFPGTVALMPTAIFGSAVAFGAIAGLALGYRKACSPSTPVKKAP